MIPCKIHRDRVEVVVHDEVRVLTIGDFVRSLADQISSAEGGESQGSGEYIQYPLNTLYCYEEVASKFFVLYYPEAVHQITGWSGSQFTIPFPNIIITVGVRATRENNWEVQYDSIRYFMTTLPPERVPFDNSPGTLANHPEIKGLALPNMGSDGAMCFGRNSIPPSQPTNEYRGLNWLHGILTDTPFNNDLSIPGKPDVRPYDWVRHLANLHREGHGFPYGEFFRSRASSLEGVPDLEETLDPDDDEDEDEDEGEYEDNFR